MASANADDGAGVFLLRKVIIEAIINYLDSQKKQAKYYQDNPRLAPYPPMKAPSFRCEELLMVLRRSVDVAEDVSDIAAVLDKHFAFYYDGQEGFSRQLLQEIYTSKREPAQRSSLLKLLDLPRTITFEGKVREITDIIGELSKPGYLTVKTELWNHLQQFWQPCPSAFALPGFAK